MDRKECMSKPRMPWPLAGCNCLQAANSNPRTPEEERMAKRFGLLPGNPSGCGWHRRPQQTCFVDPAAKCPAEWIHVGDVWEAKRAGRRRREVENGRRRRDGGEGMEEKGCLHTRACWVLWTEVMWSPAGVACLSTQCARTAILFEGRLASLSWL